MDIAQDNLDLIENDMSELRKFVRSIVKRGFDILFSAMVLLMIWPFFLIIGKRIQHENPGPIYYRGQRVGKDGKIFNIIKFRTMYECPESYTGARITGNGDTRVTPVGRWLRDTKLNELPQFWNVLKGDMSVVGPRPEDPEIVGTYNEEYRKEILSVRPGITSPASVAYHDEESRLSSTNVMGDYMDMILPDKMRMDLLYVQHHNLINDLDTIFWTFIISIPQAGKQKIPEGWLFGGPFSRFIRNYFNWFLIDFLIAFAVIVIVGLVWRLITPLDIGIGPSLLMGIVLALSMGLVNTVFGLKTVSWHEAAASDVLKLIISCFIVGTVYIAAGLYFSIIPGLPPAFIIIISILCLLGFVVARYRGRLITGLATRWVNLRKSSIGVCERVLIIGAGHAGEFTAWMLRSTDFRPYYTVVGYVDDNPAKQGMRYGGIRVLGTTTDIPYLVNRYKIGLLFFSINIIKSRDKNRILKICKNVGLPVVFVPELIEDVRKKFAESVQIQ